MSAVGVRGLRPRLDIELTSVSTCAASNLTFNVGIELGQLLVLVVLIPVLNVLFRLQPTPVRMVLVNLILNGFDAMPDGGELTVKSERAADGVHLMVRDTGCGMDEAVRRRATEPLFTTKPGGRGTGLGLSVSADVVRAAGGSLEIDSAPDAGTTVHLRLPAGEEKSSWQSAF